ncbi:MAG: NRDE family protein [Gammaproteobacteria bacterium]
MCLILLAYRAHPRFRLVIAANRDEYHARAAHPAAFWDDAPAVLAGRDAVAGGTWLGVTRGGRFAGVTNVRSAAPPRSEAASRGHLVSDFLRGSVAAGEYLRVLAADGQRYNGFNLLADDGRALWYYSNRDERPPHELAPGIYGLSNGTLDEDWPKVRVGKAGLAAALHAGRDPDHEALLALLANRDIAPDHLLPDTGIDPVRERVLSSAFILGGEYGTRCSTAITIDHRGRTDFVERRFDSTGLATGTTRHGF